MRELRKSDQKVSHIYFFPEPMEFLFNKVLVNLNIYFLSFFFSHLGCIEWNIFQ